MSVEAGRAKIKEAAGELMARWNSVRLAWHDENSREFEEKYIIPLYTRLRKVEGAMEHIDTVLNKVRNDCQ